MFDGSQSVFEKIDTLSEAQVWSWIKQASPLARVEIRKEEKVVYKMYKDEAEKTDYLNFKEVIKTIIEKEKEVPLF